MIESVSGIDRLPPHDFHCEQAVLGCQLLDPQACVPAVLEAFDGNVAQFYDLRHQELQKALYAKWSANEQIDLVTVHTALRDSGLIDQIGGIPYLNTVMDSAMSAANLPSYIKTVEEKWLLRRMIQTCSGVVGRIYDYEGDVETLVSEFEAEVMRLRKVRGDDRQKPIQKIVNEALVEIERLFEAKGQISGMSTGLPDLDKETDGLHRGDFVIVGALPSGGKTSLAINIVEHVALNLGHAVGVLSAEMSAVSIVKRSLCSVGRVNLRSVRDGFLSEADFPSLMTAAGRLSASKIIIDDTSDLTTSQIRSKARRMKQQHDIKLLVADFAQLFSHPGAESRTLEVDAVSKCFKNMAKELGIPVILLSQLNDEGRLKHARALGEDADHFWLLEPDDCDEEDENRESELITLVIKKQRNGPRGVRIPLTFMKSFTRFESRSKFSDEDVPQQK